MQKTHLIKDYYPKYTKQLLKLHNKKTHNQTKKNRPKILIEAKEDIQMANEHMKNKMLDIICYQVDTNCDTATYSLE